MTSTFATNYIDGGLDVVRYLRVDKEGLPLQKQVALSFQNYSGPGDETIVFDGSNCIVIDSTLPDGPLTIDFTAMNNYLGRYCDLVMTGVLANDLTLDFGAGNVIVPGAGAVHTATTPAGFGPLSGMIVFFSLDTAALLKSPVVVPNTIIPGTDGQVLTTVAGVAQWADPVLGGEPLIATLPIRVDASNELNDVVLQDVQWSTLGAPSFNDTTFTINSNSQFEATEAAKVDVTAQIFIPGNLDVQLRAAIVVNGVSVYSTSYSTLGLVGSTITVSSSFTIAAGQYFSILCGNAAGPDSGTRSITPTIAGDGRISIKQFPYTP